MLLDGQPRLTSLLAVIRGTLTAVRGRCRSYDENVREPDALLYRSRRPIQVVKVLNDAAR
jgi:hypothetical protein